MYKKSQGITDIKRFPCLYFILVDTGVPKNTKIQVEKVLARKERVIIMYETELNLKGIVSCHNEVYF